MNHLTCGFIVFGLLALPPASALTTRPSPQPLPQHPGNIFLAGEPVTVNLPAPRTNRWVLYNYEEEKLAEFPPGGEDALRLGALPVGFYQVRASNARPITLGVLAPLAHPTPTNSPIGLDVAMAWFYATNQMDAVANLCALAGINWVRDRLNWGEMEPRREQFAGPNRYDASARAQAQAGLRVLQVNHSSPRWANPDGRRFPLDLREAYRFYREMARRWHGQVLAFEPWNEADITMFGGHTGSEMAALQKAAYLGLKAGNPAVIACLNVFALPNKAQLADLNDNQAWPYFETFNLHHYAQFDEYPRIYAAFRAVSAGRPLWVTECSLPVQWSGDEKLKEPTDAALRTQAERVAKTFAASLHEGSVATYYFLLPHYSEGKTQFGVLHADLTPRPAFVALAAAGRLLAGARPLGRWQTTNDALRAWVFNAQPDGQAREVLVAWAATGTHSLRLPAAPQAVFDHLGRSRARRPDLELGSAPVYAVLAPGSAAPLALTPPPPPPAWSQGEAAPVVLQAVWPKEKLDLARSAYRVQESVKIPIYLYNFGERILAGALAAAAPAGWKAILVDKLELAPMQRQECALEVDCRDAASRPVDAVRITAQFGPGAPAVLSLRLAPEP